MPLRKFTCTRLWIENYLYKFFKHIYTTRRDILIFSGVPQKQKHEILKWYLYLLATTWFTRHRSGCYKRLLQNEYLRSIANLVFSAGQPIENNFFSPTFSCSSKFTFPSSPFTFYSHPSFPYLPLPRKHFIYPLISSPLFSSPYLSLTHFLWQCYLYFLPLFTSLSFFFLHFLSNTFFNFPFHCLPHPFSFLQIPLWIK